MLVFRTAADVLRAIDGGALPHEAAGFDGKRELPSKSKNVEIAVDVAAMTAEGGVILYGVDEDKENLTWAATPFPLAGVRERISDVVSSSVRERPAFDVRALSLEGDSGTGFVVVDVPASIRAPHLVEARGGYRFYGRTPGGNQQLTEAQIAGLYDRRRTAEDEASRALAEAIGVAPLEPAERRGDLHVVVKPLAGTPGLLRRVWPSESSHGEMMQLVQEVLNDLRFAELWDPNFGDTLAYTTYRATLEGGAAMTGIIGGTDRYVSRLEVLDDGTLRYFRSALASNWMGDGFQLRDGAAAQITAHALLFAGRVLDRGGFFGAVDVTVALAGIHRSVSASWAVGRIGFPPVAGYPIADRDHYQQTVRLPSVRLVEDADGVARELFDRLATALRPVNAVDPLKLLD